MKTTKSFLLSLKNFLRFAPNHQIEFVVGIDELYNELVRIDKELGQIPGNYQNAANMEQMVYAHYFYLGSDWYVLNADLENNLIYCYAILNNDVEMSEFGWVSLDEIKPTPVELDFYFTPEKLKTILKRRNPDYFCYL